MGVQALSVYRFYRIDARDRLQPAEVIDADSDGAAVAFAARLLTPALGGEQWCGARLVGRFSKLGLYTAAG
jgi:hypothetical protein